MLVSFRCQNLNNEQRVQKVLFLTSLQNYVDSLMRLEVVQPGEEMALDRPYSILPVPKEGLQESWRDFFKGCAMTEQGGMALGWNRAILC